ncbi:FAD-binding oxidoreductase [Flavobacterium sp. Sd200]|uniref:PepSY domain-containing protein n=1 Tax=Flavobacterium sp. Sd200 TaxID=2692211 RepID=UPI00136B4F1F|nr:PepSY domain-containing protein [Flavobacterium sp. Sd200]MXN90705.1 FAD-binding oxidoreductase [Flavobacterium sp. Sd200]
MTLSVWRYAHLALAVFSFLFLALASTTGTILAIDAINQKIPPYRVHNFDDITLAQTLPVLRKQYPEITEISIDQNQFVTLQGLDNDGNDVNAYIDPATGKILGEPIKKSEFIQWITSLHRSLFLHETGRIIIGINSFLLILIALSGMALVIQRQRGLKRFFSKVIKDYFAQYYHVVAGRILLIPILIIAVSGTYLSLERFKLFPEHKVNHKINTENLENSPVQKDIAGFSIFQKTFLTDVEKIEFPFADDPEEYYTLKLKEREIVVNQFNGEILSEVKHPSTLLLANLSLDLHTGRTNILWAIILAIASVNILYFIYSGFKMTLKRRAVKLKNRHKAIHSKYILLVGSENGSTLGFANAIHKQLLSNNETSHITQLNEYNIYPKAQHIIVLTSTHGLGDAPSNATKFAALLAKYPQEQTVNISVVGFGSQAYADFCGYAKEVERLLIAQPWAKHFLNLHTVDDKSATQFADWAKKWGERTQISLATTPALYKEKPADLEKIMVLDKTLVNATDQTFTITIRTGARTKFTSGDLLAIYPANDNRERLYSIGKVNGNIQLVVKLYEGGLGSGYLYNLTAGLTIKARIIRNKAFHFPKKASAVIMIANGTGVAPFLGMIAQNSKKTETHLYCGFRRETETTLHHREFAAQQTQKKQLESFHIAFSREANLCYVMDLIYNDAAFFAAILKKGGVIMICGSLVMQQDVEITLDTICQEQNNKSLSYYKDNGQVLTDCY